MQRDNEVIERIKAEANLVDIISDYVRLKRTGKNWLGLCPFHDDKKPSFTVEPVRGIYKCFSCGKGGNVFTFLQEKNGWSFPESLKYLATRYGIPLEENKRNNDKISSNEVLTNLLSEASRFFVKNLEDKKNEIAQSYVHRRGFSQETIRKFGIGYAIDSWDWLIKELQRLGGSLEDMDKAGLVVKNDRRGFYDRFRGRIIFTIHSPTGKVVGFGARRLSEDETQPKYINSPESPVYQKSKLLYGLFQAKDSIRKENKAIIVEGYADVVSLHQNGITNAVATCGTALAKEHAELIYRYAQNVVLVFDSDKAGETATIKAINILLRKGLDISILRLPQGEDPDTFVRRFGKKEFERKILMQAVSFVDFLANIHKANGDFNYPEKQAVAVRSILESIVAIPDQLKRQLYIQKFISANQLNENLVYNELKNAREKLDKEQEQDNKYEAIKAEQQTPKESNNAASVAIEKSKAKKTPLQISYIPTEEFLILKIMCDGDNQIIEHVLGNLNQEDFTLPITKEMFGVVSGYYENQRSFSFEEIHLEELTQEMQEFVAMLAIEQETTSDFWQQNYPDSKAINPWQLVEECINKFKIKKIEIEIKELQERIKQITIEDETEAGIDEYLTELMSSINQRDALNKKYL